MLHNYENAALNCWCEEVEPDCEECEIQRTGGFCKLTYHISPEEFTDLAKMKEERDDALKECSDLHVKGVDDRTDSFGWQLRAEKAEAALVEMREALGEISEMFAGCCNESCQWEEDCENCPKGIARAALKDTSDV